MVWNKLIMAKHRFIYWQFFNSQFLTRDHLSRFISIISSLCPVCDLALESHSHLFLDCLFSRRLFGEISSWLGIFKWPSSQVELQEWCFSATRDLKHQILNVFYAAALYFIWKNRNNCIFELACYNISSVSSEIRKVVKCRILGLGLHRVSKMDSYLINIVEGW
ncbi:uncharacterized protein LOC133832841 [Humulus lupulus]|uniref:uncharacterized protein LOC133832841 n=1 Tax=Humulus lupulus TaxID=3486 RepID=UPI002B413DB2|nr:uncharacterized protein LOC133832841 [Humulus lupulus]